MSLKHRILARLNSNALLDAHVYVARHGPARGLKRRGGLGWLPSFLPRPHEGEAEERFLAGLEWHGLTVFDVGGDQGLYTLFFAHRVGNGGHVVVFEPNPRSAQRIAQNVSYNHFRNVRIVPAAVGAARGVVRLTVPTAAPSRGTAAPALAAHMGREASIISYEIPVVALDDEIARGELPRPEFIKLDVEGLEYEALMGMRETLTAHRPRLTIEMHGVGMAEKVANVGRVVAFMEEVGYRLHHIESGSEITSANAAVASRGHLACLPQ